MLAGRITVLAYLVAFMLVPLVGIAILGRPDYSIYHFSGINLAGAATILALTAACFTPLFSIGGAMPRRSRPWATRAYRLLQQGILPLASVLLVLFVAFYPASQAGYRYLNSGIASLGSAFFLAVAIKTVCTALLVWLMAEYIRQPEGRPWTYRVALLILVGTMIYGASGTGDLFAASFFVLLLISPRWFVRFATIDRDASMFDRRNLYKFLGVAIIAVQAFVSLNVGENIKEGAGTVEQSIVASVREAAETIAELSGFETAQEVATIDEESRPTVGLVSTGSWFVVRILEGIASHYYSTMQFFDGSAQVKLQDYDYPLSYPLASVAYRMNVLLGGEGTERPNIQSISRLNFLVLSMFPNATEGTSPGAVAAFAYLFPLPIGLIAALAYLVLAAGLINRMFRSNLRKVSAVGGLAIMIQLQVLFQTPPDVVLLIDNGAVFVISFAVLALITRPDEDQPVVGTAKTGTT